MAAGRLLVAVFTSMMALASVAGGQDVTSRDPYARALQLEAEGNHAGALGLLWDAAGRRPNDADVQNSLGEALERMGALDAAIEAFGRALSARPAFRKAENNLILTLVKAGRGEDALRRAQALVALAPADPHARFTLGLAQSEQDLEGAIRSFRHVLALAPGHSLARYNLALVLKRADRLPEAIEQLARVIGTEPRAEAHYTLGVIYWHQGDLERAADALRAAVSAEPRYAEAHYALGAVLKDRQDLMGAVDALRRALALRPDLAGAHYTLARVLQSAGEQGASLAHLAEAERLRRRTQLEQEASVWTSVGIRELEKGEAGAALEHFRRATSLIEDYAPAHYQAGRALERLGDHEASQAAFARARELNPTLVPPGEPQ